MKKNEDVTKLLDEINKVLGDTSKSAEIFYLLKKQGSVSTKQKEEIIKLERQLVENQHQAKQYSEKFIQLLHILRQQGEISGHQQSYLLELGKKVNDNHKATREILVGIADIARTLKVTLPKTFDVSVKNISDFPTEFKISNLDKIPSPPDEVHIKKPLWLPDFFEAAFKFITEPVVIAVKKQLQNVNLTGPTDPKKAIAVRLSDGNRFYTAILQAISAAGSNSQQVEDLLQEIANNTDTLEIKADQVNLNTDTLETLLAQFQFVSGKLKVDANISIPGDPNSDVPRSTRASEATLVQVRDYLDTVEVKLQSLMDNTDGIEGEINTLNAKDFATQATLIQVRDYLDTVEAKLQTLIDGNLWQRAVLAGMGFVATTNNITVANANETVFMLIKNPSNSGKTARLHRLTIGSDENQANKMAFYRVYRDPTITNNGTALNINNLKKGAGGSVLTAFKLPTISANGTLLAVGNAGAVVQSTDQMDLGNLISLGENILITVDATAGGFDFFVTVYWEEA